MMLRNAHTVVLEQKNYQGVIICLVLNAAKIGAGSVVDDISAGTTSYLSAARVPNFPNTAFGLNF